MALITARSSILWCVVSVAIPLICSLLFPMKMIATHAPVRNSVLQLPSVYIIAGEIRFEI
jgi:bacteriorhodopsin